MQQIFETERLRIRPLSVEDSKFILELFNTEGWLKFIGDRNVKDLLDAIDYIERIMKNDQVFYNVFELKETNQAIGIVTLLQRDELLFPDIGFAILPSYEKMGFTYEASSMYLHKLMASDAQETILAITLPDNTSSIKLLEKLGLEADGAFMKGNEKLLRYSIPKPNKR